MVHLFCENFTSPVSISLLNLTRSIENGLMIESSLVLESGLRFAMDKQPTLVERVYNLSTHPRNSHTARKTNHLEA